MGRFYWNNGDIYEGEWSRNKTHGKGTFYHNQSGETIEAEWRKGELTKNDIMDTMIIINKKGKIIPKSQYF